MEGKSRARVRARAIVLVAVGLVIGTTMMATPAVAHVGGTVTHLVGHLKKTFFTKAQSNARYADAVAGTDKARDADKLDGVDSAGFAAAAHNHDSSYAGLSHNHDASYLGQTEKAADSETLDGIDSSGFMRPGSSAGGDLAGTYPNPTLGPNAVTSAEIANGSVTGADIAGSTTITASDFRYSSPRSGVLFADPALCVRDRGAPHEETRVENPPSNSFGPSMSLTTTTADGTYQFYCPVPLQVPPGAAVTLTGATLGYFDNSTTCLVGAEIRTKAFGSISMGNVHSTVYDGSSSTDYAFALTGPRTVAFPPFTTAYPAGTILWVNGILKNSGGWGSCRYSGVQLTYSVDHP